MNVLHSSGQQIMTWQLHRFSYKDWGHSRLFFRLLSVVTHHLLKKPTLAHKGFILDLKAYLIMKSKSLLAMVTIISGILSLFVAWLSTEALKKNWRKWSFHNKIVIIYMYTCTWKLFSMLVWYEIQSSSKTLPGPRIIKQT